MGSIEDFMEDACDRADLVDAAEGCQGALLLFFNEDDGGVARMKRFHMTYGDEAYLLAAAQALFTQALLDGKED